jgi:uncharacterized protein
MRFFKSALVAVLVVCAGQAWAASFDCSKAKSDVEELVCMNPRLSKLDDALAENYKIQFASDIGKGARADLVKSQKSWLQKRNKCETFKCIEDAYTSRIDAICEYPAISGINYCKTSDMID